MTVLVIWYQKVKALCKIFSYHSSS